MNPKEERPTGKIGYEKPTAVDLGPAAPVVGASCAGGQEFFQGVCYSVGNSAAEGCFGVGNSAATTCYSGSGF